MERWSITIIIVIITAFMVMISMSRYVMADNISVSPDWYGELLINNESIINNEPIITNEPVNNVHTFYTAPNFNDTWTVNTSNDKFVFQRWQDKRLEEWLTIEPCRVYDGVKEPITSTTIDSTLTLSTKDNKDNYEFSYTYDTTTAEKSLISSLCYQITNTSDKVIDEKTGTQVTSKELNYSNGILTTQSLKIDFNDIKEAGFTIDYVNDTLYVSNLTNKIWNLDPTVSFSSVLLTSIEISPLGNHTFVIAYCDDTNDDISFTVYDTNGSIVLSETDTDETAGGISYQGAVSVAPFDNDKFVIAWYDSVDYDYTFSVYNIAGSLITGPTDILSQTGAITEPSISVSTTNSTTFAVVYNDARGGKLNKLVYNINGTIVSGPSTLLLFSQTSKVSVSSLDATTFVIGYFNYANTITYYSIHGVDGTNITNSIAVDNTGLYTRDASVSAFNNTAFVQGFYDYTEQDSTFQIFSTGMVNITNAIDADAAVGTASYSTSVAAINNSAFVISWYDGVDFDLSYAMYNNVGTNLISLTDIESWPTSANIPFRVHSTISYLPAVGISFCNSNWVIAYSNTTTEGVWKSFQPNGNIWNGTCPESLVDATSPIVTLVNPPSGINTTNTSYVFSCSATDETALQNLSIWHNIGGTWSANYTVAASGATNTSMSISTTIGVPNDNYTWSCKAFDMALNSAFATNNWSVSTYTEPPPPPDTGCLNMDKIIEHWSFEDGMTGEKILVNGTNHGANYTTNSSCKLGGCYLFEQENSDYIDYASSPSNLFTALQGNTTGTVTFWVYVFSKGDSVSDFFYGIGDGDRSDLQEIFFSWFGEEEVTFRQYDNTEVDEDHTNAMGENGWHLITIGTDDSDFYCTIDAGADLCGASMTATRWWDDFGTIAAFTIGRTSVVTEYMGGYIDEFTLWSGNLNTSEISSLYYNGTGVNLTYLIDSYTPPAGPTDTCTCPVNPDNWRISMSDHCNLTVACDIDGYDVTFENGTADDYCNVYTEVRADNFYFNLMGSGTIVQLKNSSAYLKVN